MVPAVGMGGWETMENKSRSNPNRKEDKEENVFNPTVHQPGDQVLYEQYGTAEIDLDGNELVLVRVSDVLGWWDKKWRLGFPVDRVPPT